MDHVYKNNIVTPEQAMGKERVRGTVEQLLINKSILKNVRLMRRNLVTVWLDYRKAFDSIPHSWLLHALKLAKLPNHLLMAIKNLTESWYIELNLNGKDDSIVSNVIKIIPGIYQGDSLSVILFVLAPNPLSQLLRSTKRYAYGKNCQHQHTHNFFVDDFKLYVNDINTVKRQLEIVTTFSKDIGMKFVEEKCAFLQIEKGIIKEICTTKHQPPNNSTSC